MNSKRINLIKAFVIVITAGLILFGLTKVLMLKSEDGINQLQALYKQPEQSIDVLFLGSSHVFCNISTGELWDDHGIASFDLGGAEAPSWVSYYHLKEALRTQTPELICLEVSIPAINPTLYQKDEWATDNNYGMKWNSNRIEQLRLNSEGNDFYKRLLPLSIMHGRYKDIGKNDFINIRNSVRYKGFDPREDTNEINLPETGKIQEVIPCTEKAEEYTRKIIELAKDKDIPVLLFISPCEMTEEEQSICNYMKEIAESEGADYIDFNSLTDEMGVDNTTDFADPNHLNHKGNMKYTTYFGDLLVKDYKIPDRRGDKRYVSWEWDSAAQRNERADLVIMESEDPEEILQLTQRGYVIFSIENGKAYIKDNGLVVKTVDDMNFRMTYTSGDDVFLFIGKVDDENCYCTLFVNETEHQQIHSNIMYIYDSIRHEYVRSIYL